MSVRIWLMTADCWNCGTSIDLEALIRRRRVRKRRSSDAAPAARRSAPATAPPEPVPEITPEPGPAEGPAPMAHVEPPTADPVLPPPFAYRSGLGVTEASRERTRDWSDLLRQLPIWLISLLIHLLLLIALGLLTLRPSPELRQITLSTAVGPQIREGGRIQFDPTNRLPAFDLPTPKPQGELDPKTRARLVLADRDAAELRHVDRPRRLPDLTTLRRSLQQDSPSRTFVTRDPRLRVELVRREGGTTMTEAAVARGLRWLAHHQAEDGRWRLDDFREYEDCDCRGGAQLSSDSAATSLALLPFLGAGQTHQTGMYRDVVEAGLQWLVDYQSASGDLSGRSAEQARMYAHGQAAIVLCEAYAMTNDPGLRKAAERAIRFIEDAQHRRGGWRYAPGQRGDTSVLGWQMMALQSGRAAGLPVSDNVVKRSNRFLDSVSSYGGSRFGYQPGHRATPTMTAEAILCRIYLGEDPRGETIQEGLRWLVKRHPPTRRRPNIYYWYYATQALHHAGGRLWDQWNSQLREVLVDLQVEQSHAAGSWDPDGPHAHAGGRIYMTALAICTLEVYYRHAPIFRPIDIGLVTQR